MTEAAGATIADGARFDGTYKGRDLTVLGAFEGGMELSGRLRLGPKARVKGRVTAGAVEIEGEFEGEVRADELSIAAGARARGVFLAPRLTVREGARVDGTLNVESSRGAAAADGDSSPATDQAAADDGAPAEPDDPADDDAPQASPANAGVAGASA